MAFTELNKDVQSLQANTLLPALRRCLEILGTASSIHTAEGDEQGCTWLRDLLHRGAVLAQIQHPTSSFLQQEVTLLLHGQLDGRPALANVLLCAQLPVFLQHPVAIEQLLRAVPQRESSQALLYRSLCQCLTAGAPAMQLDLAACRPNLLQVIRSYAMWELQKLVTEPSSKCKGRVELAGHLPWLLHLLLLTACGEPGVRIATDTSAGSSHASACEDDSAVTQRSAGTYHAVGVPSPAHPDLSADRASTGGLEWTHGNGNSRRDSAAFSVYSTSEPFSGVESEGPGTRLEPTPRAEQATTRAAAAVLMQLRDGCSLCALIGLHAEPDLDACTDCPSGGGKEATPGRQLLDYPAQIATPDPTTLHERTAIAVQLVEVLLGALLQHGPVAEDVLMHARAFAGLNAVVEEGSDSLSKESAVFDLLSLHMQLVRAQQSQQAPDEADESLEQTGGHLHTEAVLAVSDFITANMQKQPAEARRANRRTSMSFKRGSHQQCVSPEVAAHAALLLAAMPELNNITSSDACEAATDPRTSKCWGADTATPEQPVPRDSLACWALKSALAMYDVSLAGPRPDVSYTPASQAASALEHAMGNKRRYMHLAGPAFTQCQQGKQAQTPANGGFLGKRERVQQPTHPQTLQQIKEISNATTGPSTLQSGHIATNGNFIISTKKRRIAPEPLAVQGRLSEPTSGCPPEVSCPGTSGAQSPSSKEGVGVCLGSEQGATTSAEAGTDSDDEDASPLLQRGLLADREKEEWWEHYIAVKLDLVENILGDDTAFVEEPSSSVRAAPSTADDMTTPRLGTWGEVSTAKGTPSGAASGGAVSQRRMRPADTAFREPSWQAMHVAALQMLARVLSVAHGSNAQQQQVLIRVLGEAAPEEAVLASVRNACLLIEPCCGMDTYQAAIAGAKAAPLEALPVYFAVRLGRYLSGAGHLPEPSLVSAYLTVMEGLADLAAGHATPSAKPASAKKKGGCTAPRQLLAKLLLALVDCGDIALGRAPPGPEPTNRLIRLVLVGFDTRNAFVLAASALVGLCQGMLDLKRQRAHWASAHDAGWHDAWFHAAETAEPAAAVAAAGQLLGMVAAGFEQLPGSFRVAADATIMACRAAECWEGLEVVEMEATMGGLLQLAATVQAECTAATAQLLQTLSSAGHQGSGMDEDRVRGNSMAAAYGPELAEALLRYCQWLSKAQPGFQSAQVADVEQKAVLGCKAGYSILLDHLAAADGAIVEQRTMKTDLQARVCEWLGEAYEAMAAHGVASADPEPDQDACDAMHDSALIDHSMQTDIAGCKSRDAKAARQQKRQRSSNPFVAAAMAEMAAHSFPARKRVASADDIIEEEEDDIIDSEDDDDCDDLADFIVCKPGRDYRALFAQEFKYSCAEAPKSLFRRPL
ncbi:g4681 [Coccomyxa elongata]